MRYRDTFYLKNPKFKNLTDQLIVKYDSLTVDSLLKEAGQKLASLSEPYANEPKAKKMHIQATLCYLAVYIVLKEKDSADAFEIVAEQSKANALKQRKRMLKLSNKAPRFFVFMCTLITKFLFGEKNGFSLEWKEKRKNVCRFNLHSCPYMAVCAENGCPELTRIFCDADVYAYGHLPKVAFERSETLGTGGSLCDFCYKVREA